MGTFDQRRFERMKVIGRVEILAADGSVSHVGSLFNISEGGLMLSVPYGYHFPLPLKVRANNLITERSARVAWQGSGLAGLQFGA